MAGGKDAHEFRTVAKGVRNVSEGRNDRKGYLGDIKPNSMFDDTPKKANHEFRPEGRVANVYEGRNDRKGYLGEIAPTSMFAETFASDENTRPLAGLAEVADCLVSMFEDVWMAFAAFDTNSNGSITMSEFSAGMQRLGFTAKDSRNTFKELTGNLSIAITRHDFVSLWQMGGGDVTPMKARSVSPGQRSATPPPAVVQSFGAFLDGDPSLDDLSFQDLEDSVVAFARWAQGRWHILFSIFGYQDNKGVMVGRQKVKASDFVNFVRGQGFEGNAGRVFTEINKEGPHLDRSKLSEDADFDDDRNDITMAQLVHFQQRAKALVEAMKVGDEGSPASRLTTLLRAKREGCLLRAWRRDLDVRGSGRVAFNDFMMACRRLGIPTEAKQIWSCFRPDASKLGNSAVPLELADIDSEEAENVDKLAKCLWDNFGFDLDLAWAKIDLHGRKMVTLEEWVDGLTKMHFEGNAKAIFQGLGNLGRLWRNDFEYMNVLSKVSMRAQHSAAPIKSLQSWVQKQFEGSTPVERVHDLLATLGFPEEAPPRPPARKELKVSEVLKAEEVRLSVSDLSARLTALGYPDDAMQVAQIAARTGRGTNITRESLYFLLIGKRNGAPPRRHSRMLMRAASAGQLENRAPPRTNSGKTWRPRKGWKDSVDNISLLNDNRPSCVRNYFSVPSSKSGFSIGERHVHDPERSASPKARSISPIQARIDSGLSGGARGRAESSSPPRSQRLNLSDGRSRSSLLELKEKESGWDNSLYHSSEVNNRISKHVREYFQERERPVKEEMDRRRKMRNENIVQNTLGVQNAPPSVTSPQFGSSTPPPAQLVGGTVRAASGPSAATGPFAGSQAAMQLRVALSGQATPRRKG